MNVLQKAWQFLDGRKRDIGAYAGVVIAWLVSTGKIDAETAKVITTILTIWVAGAAAHAGIKRDL